MPPLLLLEAMTEHLGPFESWPTYILQNLFIDHPSPVNNSRLRMVISFLYGNDLPLKMACDFYIACSGLTGAAARFVIEQIEEWYSQWQHSTLTRHIADYYNMLFRKFYWLNGSLLNQRDVALPEVTSMEFGIDATTHPHKIRRKVEELRTTVLEANNGSSLSDQSCAL